MITSSNRRTDHAAEEQFEIEKHVGIYRVEDANKLRMVPSDWQKIDTEPALNAYIASMQRLGDVRDQAVLDAGCGDGWLSVILAKRGAKVSGFDISPEAVEVAAQRAEVNGVPDRCDFRQASFYTLPYDDGQFALVIGQAILHHMRDKSKVAEELHRVMAPNGRALFVEAFGNSEALERFRLLLPVGNEAVEDPDHWMDKISYRDLDAFRDRFHVRCQVFHLFSRLDKVVKSPALVRALNRVDDLLLRGLPFLQRYGRIALIELTRK